MKFIDSEELRQKAQQDEQPNKVKKTNWLGNVIKIIFVFFILLLILAMQLSSAKPVIYLYPERTTDVSVKLDYNGKLEYTWPFYENGWKVTAHPDGSLVNHADGKEYSYLFWEGKTNAIQPDFSRGFVVKGADTGAFLQKTLALMGLKPREYNEFIVYWLPLMQDNAWNLISFQGKTYTDNAILTIEPKPDSVLRVYMAFKSLPYPVYIPPQEISPFERKGFTVVEWGGSEV